MRESMIDWKRMDLHIHTTVSDGTDTPEELVDRVKSAGIGLFSVTDHDAIKGCEVVRNLLSGRTGPRFITGVEFSCRDEEGQYHILGYHYDPQSESIRELAQFGHNLRMNKIHMRLDHLKTEFGITFPEKEILRILALDNPGKPHLANLMVKLGFAKTKEDAMARFLNRLHIHSEFLRPETAISGILAGGGIPVLAHPTYGNGSQLILGEDMDRRLRHLIPCGLQGVEAFYSGFTPKIREETLQFAKQYDLYVTAGSDYHGRNKLVNLGDTGLDETENPPEGLLRFLDAVREA